jgi:hypothetical protein
MTESNTTKYDFYTESWRRMKAATDGGFFLEAIAIQESLIFDRICSFVEHAAKEEVKDNCPKSELAGNEVLADLPHRLLTN